MRGECVSSAARRSALEWLAGGLAIEREVRISSLRWHWVAAGLISLLLLVLLWNGLPAPAPTDEPWPRAAFEILTDRIDHGIPFGV